MDLVAIFALGGCAACPQAETRSTMKQMGRPVTATFIVPFLWKAIGVLLGVSVTILHYLYLLYTFGLCFDGGASSLE